MVIILSTVNTGSMPQPDISQMDKVVHFMLYMIFTFLIIYDLKKTGLMHDSRKLQFFSAAVVSSAFGGCMELLQLIPELNRSCDIVDFFANTAGSASAVILFLPVNRIINIVSEKFSG